MGKKLRAWFLKAPETLAKAAQVSEYIAKCKLAVYRRRQSNDIKKNDCGRELAGRC